MDQPRSPSHAGQRGLLWQLRSPGTEQLAGRRHAGFPLPARDPVHRAKRRRLCRSTPQTLSRPHLPYGTGGGEGAGAGSLRQRVPSREESLCHTEEAGRTRAPVGGGGGGGAACSYVCPSVDRCVGPSPEPAAAALSLAAPSARRAPAPAPTRPRRRRRASAGYTSSSSELMCKICCAASSGKASRPLTAAAGAVGPPSSPCAPSEFRTVTSTRPSCKRPWQPQNPGVRGTPILPPSAS